MEKLKRILNENKKFVDSLNNLKTSKNYYHSKDRHLRIHELKIEFKHYVDILAGNKRAEIRNNDRGFKVGDALYFKEIINDHGINRMQQHTHDSVVTLHVITHVLDDPSYLQNGHVCLSFISCSVGINRPATAFGIGSNSRRAANTLNVNWDLVQNWLKGLNWVDAL